GVQIGGELLETKEEDWDKILGVNLKGVAYSSKASLPSMIKRGSGSIGPGY
ncbi:SDR family NAD(P)-dependent oxidoreductase, partial [bacterium]|nr:SDR family NAD(P)-dependent oxidoreductase [bacterium]